MAKLSSHLHVPLPDTPHVKGTNMPESFFPGQLWADNKGAHINAHGGGILFHEGTYYWYGEHKIEGDAGNRAHVGIHVYSSTDLYHWTDRGIALPVSSDPASEITAGCIIERPKVLFNAATNKFVMWFHLEHKDQQYKTARSAVALADAPTGPFTFLHSLRPNAGLWPENLPDEAKQPITHEETTYLATLDLHGSPVPGFPADFLFKRDFDSGQMARDMTLFLDDDGSAWHLYASEENGTLHLSQLSADFTRPAGHYVRLLPGEFNEAPALLKHHAKYYLFTSGCTGWNPNPARLAVADKITGPYKPLGNPCIGPDADTTFDSQPTFILPVQNMPDAYIFMADRWRPKNAIDGRYVWLPIQFTKDDHPFLEFFQEWDLSIFEQ